MIRHRLPPSPWSPAPESTDITARWTPEQVWLSSTTASRSHVRRKNKSRTSELDELSAVVAPGALLFPRLHRSSDVLRSSHKHFWDFTGFFSVSHLLVHLTSATTAVKDSLVFTLRILSVVLPVVELGGEREVGRHVGVLSAVLHEVVTDTIWKKKERKSVVT